MRILVDTHLFLWLLSDRRPFSTTIVGLLKDPSTQLFLSAASTWEISIKYALRKLPLPSPPATYIPARMHDAGIEGLAVNHRHALGVATLPHHHKDPFDRILIAQAMIEGLSILTVDDEFDSYDVEVIRPT